MRIARKFFYFINLVIILVSCEKLNIERQIRLKCDSLNFGIVVNKETILCGTKERSTPQIDPNGELRMIYMLNDNCCSYIYFNTSNFQKNGSSKIIVQMFEILDSKIRYINANQEINGNLNIKKINGNMLSATFDADFIDEKGKMIHIEGSFKDIKIAGL